MALLWSPYPDLNWGPLPYQGSALPLSYMGIISTLSRTTNLNFARHIMERVKGIEPSYSDWKSEVLPLNYTRKISCAAGYQLLIILSNQLRGRFSSEPTQNRARNRKHYKLLTIRSSTIWWRGVDSNHRRRSRQIYNLIPLATREPLQKLSGSFCWRIKPLSMHKASKTAPELTFRRIHSASRQNKGPPQGSPFILVPAPRIERGTY